MLLEFKCAADQRVARWQISKRWPREAAGKFFVVYPVEGALSFSVAGGVYLARDIKTNRQVVLKEARPHVVYDVDGFDAVERLRKEKEYDILHHLAPLHVTPIPIELFEEWEHLFLVEEFVIGTDITQWVTRESPLLDPDMSFNEAVELNRRTVRLWHALAVAVRSIHEAGVVLGDLSPANVIVTSADGSAVKFVDLESAFRPEVDPPGTIHTPGCVPKDSTKGSQDSDRYGLGVLMANAFFPISSFLDQDPQAVWRLMADLQGACGLPEPLAMLPGRLMFEPGMTLEQVISATSEALNTNRTTHPHPFPKPCISFSDLKDLAYGLVQEIEQSQDFLRNDALVPGDPQVYLTNPLSVGYGACGVAYALRRLSSSDLGRTLNWILRHDLTDDRYPAGLYVGLSGIAWVLTDFGLDDIGASVLRVARHHPSLALRPDLFYGLSGYVLACLHQWIVTGDRFFLSEAYNRGKQLLAQGISERSGCLRWVDHKGQQWLGYALGPSGVAMALLRLFQATREARFLEATEAGLRYEYDQCVIVRGYKGLARGVVGAAGNPVSHYWYDGTAGTAQVYAALYEETGDPEALNRACTLATHSYRPFATFPGLFNGKAGIANVMLNVWAVTGKEEYFERAVEFARRIRLYAVDLGGRTGLPGDLLFRRSNDYGTGAAGVALVTATRR